MHKLLLLFSLCLCINIQAQKFGHVDSMALLESMPEAEAIQKTLDEEQNRIETQLTTLQEEFGKMYDAAEEAASKGELSDEEIEQKQAELEETYNKIQEFVEISRQQLQEKQGELVAPILAKVRQAIEEIGQEEGFLYIFDTSQQFAAIQHVGSQSVDITPLIKKKLGIQ